MKIIKTPPFNNHQTSKQKQKQNLQRARLGVRTTSLEQAWRFDTIVADFLFATVNQAPAIVVVECLLVFLFLLLVVLCPLLLLLPLFRQIGGDQREIALSKVPDAKILQAQV